MNESRCKIPYRAKLVSIACFRSVLDGGQNILLRKGRRIVPTDRYGHALTFDFGIVSRGYDDAEIRSAFGESIGEIGAEEFGKSLEYGVYVTIVRRCDFDGVEDVGGESIGDAGIAKEESLSVEAGERFDDLGCVVGTDVADDVFFGGEVERFDGCLGEHGEVGQRHGCGIFGVLLAHSFVALSGSEYVHVFEFVFPSRGFPHGVDDCLAELVVGGLLLIGGGGFDFEGATCLRSCVDLDIAMINGFLNILGVVVWRAQEVVVFGEDEADDEA